MHTWHSFSGIMGCLSFSLSHTSRQTVTAMAQSPEWDCKEIWAWHRSTFQLGLHIVDSAHERRYEPETSVHTQSQQLLWLAMTLHAHFSLQPAKPFMFACFYGLIQLQMAPFILHTHEKQERFMEELNCWWLHFVPWPPAEPVLYTSLLTAMNKNPGN